MSYKINTEAGHAYIACQDDHGEWWDVADATESEIADAVEEYIESAGESLTDENRAELRGLCAPTEVDTEVDAEAVAGAAAHLVRMRLQGQGVSPVAGVFARDAMAGDRRMLRVEDTIAEVVVPIAAEYGLDSYMLTRPLDGDMDPAGETKRRILAAFASAVR